MSWVDEKLTERFYEWEIRGRGWQIFNSPVLPEPPFSEFDGHYLPAQPVRDDGRIPTRLSSIVDALRHRTDPPDATTADTTEDRDPDVERFERAAITELRITLPRDFDGSRETFEQFLFNLGACTDPISFEVVAAREKITIQFAASPVDAAILRRALQSYFPSAVVTTQDEPLAMLWTEVANRESIIVEFGLKEEFMIPIASRRSDFLLALTAVFSELATDEVAVFQVLFSPARSAWAASALRAVSDDEGKPFFSNRPELFASAKIKIARPLFAAVVRVAALCKDADRSISVASHISTILESIGNPSSNAFVPLNPADYPPAEHEHDLLMRQSRRAGMLLNSDELMLTVHLPTPAVQAQKLVREINKTHAAPASLQGEHGILIGSNAHAGSEIDVRLTPEQRVRHVHIIGAPGSGKSTLLFNMIRQDIEQGAGIALFDPHGDLAESILDIIPTNRVNDVIYIDPADADYSVGFNVLAAASDLEKTLLSSDLVSIFQRLSTSWGDQMNSVLQNAILAFVESDRGGTLTDLRRFLLDPTYRGEFLNSVRDPEIVYYWQKGFPQLAGNKSIGPILTRLETFLSPKPIRAMVSQPTNRLDFGAIMNTGKIFIAKLSQGQIGRENAYLLGSLFVSKFQQAAMARQSQAQEHRRDFWMYVDEFHHFITPSMAEIVTGARKYRVGLTLAHQELSQLQRDNTVGSAVLSTHVRIVFRVNDADSRALSDGFANFKAEDLRNLEIGNAICRVERSDFDFNLRAPSPGEFRSNSALAPPDEVIAASRTKYAALRSDMEKNFHPPAKAGGETLQSKPEPPTAVQATPEPTKIVAQPAVAVAESQAPSLEIAAQPEIPKTLGKGGQQHTYLQQLIKQWAQGMGYMAVIEEPLPGGGQIDIALKKRERLIACEISITTPAAYEIGNIKKSLAAGYGLVAMVSPDQKRVAGLEKIIVSKLAPDEIAKVLFVTPDMLFALIEELEAKDATHEQTVRGYRVKVSHQVVDQTTKADRLKMLAKVVAESLKRTKE